MSEFLRKNNRFLVFLLPFLLFGCASNPLSEQQCINANWHDIGYNDGSQGYYEDRIEQHSQSCAPIGVVPHYQQWFDGFKQGLKENYCTTERVYQRATLGHRYHQECRLVTDESSIRAHNLGVELYKARKELEQLKQKLHDLRKERDALLAKQENFSYNDRHRLIHIERTIGVVHYEIAKQEAIIYRMSQRAL